MYEKYFEKLEKEFAIRNRKESSLHTYKHSIKLFLDWCGKSPEEVTLEDAHDFIYELRINQKKSTQYCNGINSALKFFYRHVLKKSWDQDVVPRMINDLKLPEVLPLESIERMIEVSTEVRNKAIIGWLFLLYCRKIIQLRYQVLLRGVVVLAILHISGKQII